MDSGWGHTTPEPNAHINYAKPTSICEFPTHSNNNQLHGDGKVALVATFPMPDVRFLGTATSPKARRRHCSKTTSAQRVGDKNVAPRPHCLPPLTQRVAPRRRSPTTTVTVWFVRACMNMQPHLAPHRRATLALSLLLFAARRSLCGSLGTYRPRSGAGRPLRPMRRIGSGAPV